MDKTNILFVCQGNICRSPSAEAVFKALIKKKGLADKFEIDSAGTIAYHVGEPADRRMQTHAYQRGYRLTSISRQINPHTDFDHFDLIIAMDNENLHSLRRIARNEADLNKLSKITDYCRKLDYDEVPDPYYGGAAGFELVLDILEDACEGLLEKLTAKP